MADLDDVLRKVQGLLAKAESTTFPAEAESLREMAERLMWKYRIDEAMFRDTSGPGAAPTWREWPVCSRFSEYATTYWALCSAIILHLDVRAVRVDRGGGEYVTNACGYEAELRMAETMYTEFRLAFARQMEPKVDPSLTDQVNAYHLRSAGLEGRRIAEMLYGQNTKSLRSKVRGMFVKEATLRGENPKRLLGEGPVKGFRKDFADGFLGETWARLAHMRRTRGDVEMGLVLASSKEKVDEEFWSRYPDLRPRPAKGSLSNDGAIDSHENCALCKKAKSGYCRTHAWLKPVRGKVQRFNSAAYSRGRAAASSVDVGGAPGGRIER